MDKVKVFASHHRFNFLLQGLPKTWQFSCSSVVDKTMLWQTPCTQIFWECHDGLVDEVPHESIHRLWLCLQARSKTHKFVYVKPTFSARASNPFIKMIEKYDGTLLTCPRWSIYSAVTLDAGLHTNRVQFREQRKRQNKNKIAFFGNPSTQSFDTSSCWCPQLNCDIIGSDAKFFDLPAVEPKIVKIDRSLQVKQANDVWGDRFISKWGLTPKHYVRHLTGIETEAPQFCFQPHGVGLRHSIYECMALGIPSIVPENSYLTDSLRSCNIICKPDELLANPKNYEELSEKCVDIYESTMTPQAIVNDVIRQLKELNLT